MLKWVLKDWSYFFLCCLSNGPNVKKVIVKMSNTKIKKYVFEMKRIVKRRASALQKEKTHKSRLSKCKKFRVKKT